MSEEDAENYVDFCSAFASEWIQTQTKTSTKKNEIEEFLIEAEPPEDVDDVDYNTYAIKLTILAFEENYDAANAQVSFFTSLMGILVKKWL